MFEFAKAGVRAAVNVGTISLYEYKDFIMSACLCAFHLANLSHLRYLFLSRSAGLISCTLSACCSCLQLG